MSDKLFITGIPGMGKTSLGNFLEKELSFVHVDMECGNIPPLEKVMKVPSKVVVTWGFVPDDGAIIIINDFRGDGFKLIWLDGDRDAAKREFIKRDSQFGEEYLSSQLNALTAQLKRIEDSDIVNLLKPIVINTFNINHEFRNMEDVVKEILND